MLFRSLYAFFDVLAKIHFKNHSNNPYHLMFFVRLFSFLLIIPLDLFVYFYNDKSKFGLDIISQTIDLFSLSFVLKFIFDIIVEFICLLSIILTIYYFTPSHFIICQVLSKFLSKCIGWITQNNQDKNDEWYLILIYVFLYGIIIFASLIYNEVIIINLCSMEKDTFKYISIRGRFECNNLKIYDEEDIVRSNTTISTLSLSYEAKDDKEEKK